MLSWLARRGALLTAALGLARLRWHEPVPPAVALLATWMDSWRGGGAVVAGMTAQGFNVQMREFPEGWRANFYAVWMAHSVDRLTRGLQPLPPVRSTSPLGAAHRVGVLAAHAREALRRVVWVTPGG